MPRLLSPRARGRSEPTPRRLQESEAQWALCVLHCESDECSDGFEKNDTDGVGATKMHLSHSFGLNRLLWVHVRAIGRAKPAL